MRQRGGRGDTVTSGSKRADGNGGIAGGGASSSKRSMRSAVAGCVRNQEGSGLPHPGSSQARQERLTRSILASAEASPCGSPVNSAASRSASNSRTLDKPN